ncbi:hypothetical protein [Pseudoprimorskyibacter insulae]|uniref:Uncharacterized protein n=1 Tax=Pseudoprimorskyibacter insulae TaxID=1695997 RepID=A0A2R8B1C1_9RHOB|nr:hypothetical protein [Pseudoprimorskyibacter insulae]SPF81919.1 hypothetical protein PRI8871_03745 [Pseudoprimorskyibacter insulae]
MDKLVLTQALRIPDPVEADLGSSLGQEDDVLLDTTDLAEGLDEPAAPDDVSLDVSQDATLAEVSALAQRLGGLTDKAAKEAILEELRIALFQRFPAQVAEAAEAPAPAAEMPAPVMDDVIPLTLLKAVEAEETPSDRARTLEEKIAELEAMIGRGQGEWESETGDAMADPVAPMPEVWDELTAPEETAAEVVDAPAASEAPAAEASAEVPEAPMALDVDPDTSITAPEADEAPTPHVLFAHRAPEKSAEAPRRPDFPPLRAVPNSATKATGMDEAALRGLIQQVLQEELRGVLGERITRNVRKMVRREIQRALMARELE